MFGYITVNKDELKVKDFEYYRSCYCGMCHTLRKSHGVLSTMTLTYDMTFLSILLSSLYESEYELNCRRCLEHIGKKQKMRENDITQYAADMTLLLAYHNLIDDWKDQRNIIKLGMAVGVEKEYRKISRKYKRQTKAVLDYMSKLTKVERSKTYNLDEASGYTGDLFREIFIYKQDEWAETLGNIGFYMGKFIYLMDAYEDIEEDIKNKNYNPFSDLFWEPDFMEKSETILNLMGASAASEFELLPILENTDILRNVLYSGIWVKYAQVKKKRIDERIGKSNGV